MSKFNAGLARKNLRRLVEKFEVLAGRFPDFRHYLVEAPDERFPGLEKTPPEFSVSMLSEAEPVSVYRASLFRDPGPPARTHFYLCNRGLRGEDVEEFRKLASQAWGIIAGWVADGPGLPSGIDLPRLAPRRGRGEARQAEAFALLVHRVAWTGRADNNLRADVSMPELFPYDLPDGLPDGHPALEPAMRVDIHIDPTIPPDCFTSSVAGMDFFEASALAIKTIMATTWQDTVRDTEPQAVAAQPEGLGTMDPPGRAEAACSPELIPIAVEVPDKSRTATPAWNPDDRRLTFGDWMWIFRKDAKRAILLMNSFAKNEWKEANRPFGDDQEILHETIKYLNKIDNIPINFERRGLNALWSRVSPDPGEL